MELNEMEKKLLFQVEGDYQTKILNELYQLSLWWVKYRAQPEATNPRNHAGTQRTMVNRNKLR